MVRSIGVMGGTFNPIHMGHLIVAQAAMEEFGLDEIIFVPNRTPPHRRGENWLLESENRYIMAQLATMSNPAFTVSRIELDRPGLSYTFDTIQEMKAAMPNTEISFITGIDSLLQDPWHKLDDLLKILKRFIAATRPGFDERELIERKKELELSYGDKIVIMKIRGVAISSTMIRERIRQGKSIKYMVPESVESFINKYHLYVK